MREGERTASWWIVESGRLVESTGADSARRDVRFLRAGDVFGEVGALDASARLTSVTAVGVCRLLELDAAVLGELGTLDPAFASKLGDRAKLHLSRIAGSNQLDPRIEPDQPANLCLVDLDARWEAGAEGYASRSANCCFHGRTLHGRVLLTIAAGSIAHRGRLLAEAGTLSR